MSLGPLLWHVSIILSVASHTDFSCRSNENDKRYRVSLQETERERKKKSRDKYKEKLTKNWRLNTNKTNKFSPNERKKIKEKQIECTPETPKLLLHMPIRPFVLSTFAHFRCGGRQRARVCSIWRAIDLWRLQR